ncbi:hypothetical protein BC567DRAFT_226364 [Phyllosticta citribraziliensis]
MLFAFLVVVLGELSRAGDGDAGNARSVDALAATEADFKHHLARRRISWRELIVRLGREGTRSEKSVSFAVVKGVRCFGFEVLRSRLSSRVYMWRHEQNLLLLLRRRAILLRGARGKHGRIGSRSGERGVCFEARQF